MKKTTKKLTPEAEDLAKLKLVFDAFADDRWNVEARLIADLDYTKTELRRLSVELKVTTERYNQAYKVGAELAVTKDNLANALAKLVNESHLS